MVDFSELLNRLPSGDEWAASVERMPAARDAASPFVAGPQAEDLVRAVEDLHGRGLSASVTHLPGPGPYPAGLHAAIAALADAHAAVGTDLLVDLAELSPATGVDPDAARADVQALCAAAEQVGMTLTIVSGGHEQVGAALAIHRALAEAHPDLGIGVAANLLRAEADCGDLARAGARVRLDRRPARGVQSATLRGVHEIDKAFVRCARALTEGGARTTIATDDPRLIEIAGALAARGDGQPVGYEFRLGLLGNQVAELVATGSAVSVLVPFGPGWPAYVAGQVPARPAALAAAVRAALGGESR